MSSHNSGEVSQEAREEYLEKLRQWLEVARLWHSAYNNELNLHTSMVYDANLPYSYQNLPQNNGTINIFPSAPPQINPNVRYFKEYVIPPLWKRMIAEVVDFLILFGIKICLFLVVLEICIALNLESYGIEVVQKFPKVVVQIAVLEVVQGIIALIYETYWLSSEPCATPGKRYMGLAVIHVEHIYPVPDQQVPTVLAYPSAPLGYKKAFLRSFTKHVFLAFLIPVFYMLMFLEFNRTGYDVFSNTMVVEYNPNPRTFPLR